MYGGRMTDAQIWLTKAVALACLAAALFTGGAWVGSQHVQARWDSEAANRTRAESSAIMARTSENARIAEKQRANEQNRRKVHTDEIGNIIADRLNAGRLRVPESICAGFAGATEAASTSRGDATTSRGRLLPETIERDLRDLMAEADTIVANCRMAQGFLFDSGLTE